MVVSNVHLNMSEGSMSVQEETRERVLSSACRLFAEQGFRDTTVAEICDQADANIAAVNYYFGSKESLYREVWARASDLNRAAYPDDPAGEADPTQWLRTHVRGRVSSIFDAGPGGWFPRLLQREMANPTPLMQELKQEFLAPRIQHLDHMVELLLGPDATLQQVRCCALNIVSLYAFLNIGKMARQRLLEDGPATPEKLEAIICQTQAFALAAVDGVRRSIAAGDLS
jgi:AcrR family transcriptional regulator